MAKLKIAHEQASGIKSGQSITNSQGGVGGIPQWITIDGVKTIDCQYRTSAGVLHANAYIISQKGTKKFLVANAVGAVNGATHSNASITVATLTAGADIANATPASGASTLTITGYNTSNAAFYVSRITTNHVYDFSGNKYRYRTTAVATATFANVASH